MNFDYAENSGKKAFLVNPKINIMHPKVENMIAMLIIKRMEIIMRIKFVSFLE